MTTDHPDTMMRHRDVTVPMEGEDGNVCAIIGRVGRALKKTGYRAEALVFYHEAQQYRTYDAVLDLVRRTVATE